MPDYDLGTAHGRIKIESDTRGTNDADRALNDFERTVKSIDRQLKQLNSTMNRVEKEMQSVGQSMEQMNQHTKNFERSLNETSRSTQRTSRSLRIFAADLTFAAKMAKTAHNNIGAIVPLLVAIGKAANALRGSTGSITEMLSALKRSGAAAAGLGLIAGSILGLRKSMKEMPRWSQNLLAFSRGFTALAASAAIIGRVSGATNLLSRGFSLMTRDSERARRGLALFQRTLTQIPDGIKRLIFGIAIARGGLKKFESMFGFFTKLPGIVKAGIVGAIGLILASVELAGKALTGLSNILVGTLGSVKSLAGGLLAIPGALGILATIGGTVFGIFNGLKDAFKGITKSTAEANEAISKMPDYMKPIAKAVYDVVPAFKGLRGIMQATFMEGGEVQIRKLTSGYLPALSNGVLQTSGSLAKAKDQLAVFLSEGKTVSDISRIFMSTTQTVNGLSNALVPFANGMRDIAVVGAQFIATMTGGAAGLTKQFENWAKTNRENGNLMRWMQNAAEGVKDLYDGMVNLTKATWSFLTLFKTNTGGNALERFADSMKKLNDTVENSSAAGLLRDLRVGVKGLGTDSIEKFKTAFGEIWDTVKEGIPVFREISQTASSILVPALEITLGAIRGITKAFNAIGGGQIVGVILGIVGAWKLMMLVITPLIATIKVLVGAFMALRGVQTILATTTAALAAMGPAGVVASRALGSVGVAASVMAGPIGIAIAAIGAMVLAWTAASDDVANANEIMGAESKLATESYQKLREAFASDNGQVGSNVIDTMTLSVTNLRDELKQTADAMPGMLDHVKGFIQGINPFGQDRVNSGDGAVDAKWVNDLQKSAEEAQKAGDAIDKLGLTNKQLSAIIRGSDADFANFTNQLKASGEGGELAARKLQTYRDQFKQLQSDFDKLGPGGAMLAEGIEKIASAGANATEKLNGLKLALQGLGLIQTNAYDAAFNYQNAIQDIADKAAQAVQGITKFDDILNSTGTGLNTSSQAAAAFYNTLKPVADALLQAVANGQGVDEAFAQLEPTLQQLATSFQLPIEKVRELATSIFGLSKERINILLELSGKDSMTQGIGQALLEAQQKAAAGVEIPIKVGDPKAVSDEINKILGRDATSSNGNLLLIKPGISEDDMAKLEAEMAKRGIKMPKGPDPVAPPTAPVAPAPAVIAPAIPEPETPKSKQTLQQKRMFNGPAPAMPIAPAPTVAPAPVQPQQPVAPPVDASTQAQQPVAPPVDASTQAQANNLASLPQSGTVAWIAFKDTVNSVIAELTTTLQTFFTGSTEIMNNVIAGQRGRGQSFSGDFAQGILDNKQAVIDAATQVAQEARDRMPGSPAKKGPLSGSGWSGNSGKAFSGDFASGISSGSGAVGSAAAGVAGSARNGLNSGPGSGAGEFLGQIKQLVDFGSRINEVFKKISDTVFQVIKFASDPLGEGKFFGKSLGYRRDPSVSDADLLRRRQDKMQNDLSTIAGGRLPDGQGGGRKGSQANLGGVPAGMTVVPLTQNSDGTWTSTDPEWAKLIKRESGGINQRQKITDSNSGGNEAEGLFQITPKTWAAMGGKEFSESAILATPQQQAAIAAKILQANPSGSDWGAGISGREDAGKLMSGLTKATQAQTNAITGTPGATSGAGYGLKAGTDTYGYGQGNASVFPPWVMTLAARFGLKPSTYAGHQESDRHEAGYAPNPNHENRGIDWVGSTEAMQKFADYMAKIPTVEQVIFRNKDTGQDTEAVASQARPGYFASDLADHADHVHTRQVQEIGSPGDIPDNSATGTRHGNNDRKPGPDLDKLTPDQLSAIQDNTQYSLQTQDQMLDQLRQSNGLLDQQIRLGQDPNSTDAQVIDSLNGLQGEIDRQNEANTPASRQSAQGLEQLKNQIAGDRGIAQEQNPVDTAATIASSASSIAGDIFKVINSTLESIGAAKNIGDTLVRGVENSEDIYNMIDDIQKFIELAANVAGAVSSVISAVGAIGSAAGGVDMGASGAITAAGQIAGFVQAGIETLNAVIDLGQEAYRIVGTYVGEFLGFLAGGPGGKLEGNVNFLLDQNDNTLKAYSSDNPADKRSHTLPFSERGPEAQPQIGQVNVYGGPGSDPRDNTRDMMFAVRSAQMGSGVLN